MGLDQGRGLDREITNKGRLKQLVLPEVLPEVFDQLAVVFGRLLLQAQPVSDSPQMLNAGLGVISSPRDSERDSYMLI